MRTWRRPAEARAAVALPVLAEAPRRSRRRWGRVRRRPAAPSRAAAARTPGAEDARRTASRQAAARETARALGHGSRPSDHEDGRVVVADPALQDLLALDRRRLDVEPAVVLGGRMCSPFSTWWMRWPMRFSREMAGMSSMARTRPPGTSRPRHSASTARDVVVGEVVQQAEDQDLVEAGVGQVDLAGVADQERALAGALRVLDVARVEVDADVVVAREEVGERAGPAAEVQRAQRRCPGRSSRRITARMALKSFSRMPRKKMKRTGWSEIFSTSLRRVPCRKRRKSERRRHSASTCYPKSVAAVAIGTAKARTAHVVGWNVELDPDVLRTTIGV